tara:strand:+ start:4612 stop:4746 length:135 start_codon:yes stop_codon:yes gene_type:complete
MKSKVTLILLVYENDSPELAKVKKLKKYPSPIAKKNPLFTKWIF